MSQHEIQQVRAAVHRALEGIGNKNGSKLPAGGSNTDAYLHELYVAAEIKSYAGPRYDSALADAITAADADDVINGKMQSVIANDLKDSVMLVDGSSGGHYTFSLDFTKPASRLDASRLKTLLQTECGLSAAVVDAMFDKATTKSKPAKRFKVMPTAG